MKMKHGLGRGLKALIKEEPTQEETTSTESPGVARIMVSDIERSTVQPRRVFSDETMADLVQSIREKGIVQPLLVRRKGEKYELVAGERRLRAAREAGLKDLPVIVLEASDREALELALVENLQREDLNILEEAEGYRTLTDRFSMTQEQVADRVGKARATVANAVRILDLSDEVKSCIADGSLSAGHAKVLLGLEIPAEQDLLARRTVKEGLSVRALERLVIRTKRVPRKPRAARDDIPSDYVTHITDVLHRHLGTSVSVVACKSLANGKKRKGRVEIDFYSAEEFDRILELLGVSPEE